jgi:hypothetical protein
MKPKEFDDLVRQRFDQADFAYSPKNWDRLAEQMDGRAKKRSILMWWIMPLAGVAASVALAMGVAPVMKQGLPGQSGIGAGIAHVQKTEGGDRTARTNSSAAPVASSTYEQPAAMHPHKRAAVQANEAVTESGEDVRINLANAVPNNVKQRKTELSLLQKEETIVKKETKKEPEQQEIASTFKPEEQQKAPRTSIILNGGYNHGTQSSGYMAGVTVRRMVTERVYIESDVAFVGSGTTQTGYEYVAAAPGATGAGNGNPVPTPSTTPTGKVTQNSGGQEQKPLPEGVTTAKDVTYNLYYAQISPSVGCKISRRMSLGAGPDFQQVIGGTAPNLDPSGTYKGAIQQTPMLDIGLTGKTEYALTKKVKAGVYYRKAINNALAGGAGKYIDRDYLQFQLRCAIFNK